VLSQQHDVAAAHAQRRRLQAQYVQPE